MAAPWAPCVPAAPCTVEPPWPFFASSTPCAWALIVRISPASNAPIGRSGSERAFMSSPPDSCNRAEYTPSCLRTANPRDVVIAGAGIAGIIAAIEALGRGRRVILLDRDVEENLGGQAKDSFGGLWFAGTPLQRRRGIKDSVELALSDWFAFGELGTGTRVAASLGAGICRTLRAGCP